MSGLNQLRQMIEAGVISPEDAEMISGNALADLMQPVSMPQRPNVAPMPMNAMRNEQTGEMIDLDFGGQPQARPQPKLGAEVEVAGKGRGRYAPDGRSVVFADGSTHDLFPQRSYELAKQAFERRKAEADLRNKNASTAKTLEEVTDARQARGEKQRERDLLDGMVPQSVLEKIYGKAPKDMRWDMNGQAVPVAGGNVDVGAQEAAQGATETIRKLDEMIGQRDSAGNLVPGSAPHEGFEDAVGATWKPFARHVPGTDAADFSARLDEIKGGAFLKAFEDLKGGGQITQIEGEKATAAITRMQLAQSETEFIKAAQEFREVVRKGLERAQGQQAPKASGGASRVRRYNPATGKIE